MRLPSATAAMAASTVSRTSAAGPASAPAPFFGAARFFAADGRAGLVLFAVGLVAAVVLDAVLRRNGLKPNDQ